MSVPRAHPGSRGESRGDQRSQRSRGQRARSTTRLYLDGSAFGAVIAIDPDLLEIDPGGLIFGQDQDVLGGDFAADESWAGAMDNLRIYNRALSADEIKRVAEEAHS